MRNWKLSQQLTILSLAPAIIVAVLLASYYALVMVQHLEDEVLKKGNALAGSLASASALAVDSANPQLLRNLVRSLTEETDIIGVQIDNATGDTLFREQRPEVRDRQLDSLLPRIANAFYVQDTMSFTRVIEAATPSRAETSGSSAAMVRLGSVRLELFIGEVNDERAKILLAGVLSVLALLALMAVLTAYVGRAVARPIKQVLSAIGELKKGRLDARVPVTAGSDVGALQQGVNLLAERLNQSNEQVRGAVNLSTAELNQKINEINQKNHELEIARARAEDANLAKSRFLANMSHELRTPMNAIIGFTDLLGEFKVDEAHADYVDTIRRSAADLLVLINEILDYSKIESGELKIEACEFDFYELVDGIINLLDKTAFQRNLDLLVSIDPGIPVKLISDPLRLKQVIINLLSNAIKFTNEGTVSLEVHRRGAHPDQAEDYLEFRVIDTGIGIDEANAQRVFEPFAQSDDSLTREHSGTGLGLSITKSFVDKLGGDIGFTSKPAKGSTFWFTLPVASRDPIIYYRQRPYEPFAVLVYDRHPKRSDYTEDLLKGWGLDVTRTDSIEAFIKEYESPKYKLILYYLNRNDLDTDLQISIAHLAQSDAVKFFMHHSNYYEDLSPATGFVHLSSLISPARLFELIYERLYAQDLGDAGAHDTGEHVIDNLQGLKILIADDNDINQHLLQVYISRNGGDYLAAKDGQEAIDVAANTGADVIIMDVHMPRVDGIHAMQTIKAAKAALPVIALTADASPENQSKYLDMGFDYCLTKPVTEKGLILAIIGVLTHRPQAKREAAAPNQDRTDSELPVVDVEKAVKISGGKQALAHELFNMLLADLKSKRTQLVLDDKRDAEAVKELAHKIRGGAKYCAAERVQLHAAKIEDAINRHKNEKTIEALLNRLNESINEILTIENPYL